MSLMSSLRRILPVAALAATFALSPVALAQDGTPETAPVPYAPPADIDDLSGEISADGSSTVGPLTTFAAEEFSAIGSDVAITVDISGSGAGFERFCNGEIDLSNASREINEAEMALCAENGVEFYQFDIAYDGITLAVSTDNEFLQCISVETLSQIFVANSQITTWSQVSPDFPDEEISFYTAADTSGTYDYFVETLGIDEEGQRGVADGDMRVTSGEDDNALVEGIAGDEFAIGYFGYSYFAENQDRLRAVSISESGDMGECVAPSVETISDGTYSPLSRPLFLYVNAKELTESAALQEFLRFYVAEADSIAEGVDFIAGPPSNYAEAQTKLEGAIAGEIAPDSAAT